MPVLFAFREDRFGFRYEVGDRALLGRGPECDLILFDRATSRTHAEIINTEDGYILKDLGSTNGTLHNEVRLEGEAPLKRNDEIRVGQEVFLFDPDLDVAVGREGAVLIVGEVPSEPEGRFMGPCEADLTAFERGNLLPLYQVAAALSNRPSKGRVLKQTAYVLNKVFGATGIVLLWPESVDIHRLTALLSRPEGRRQVLPRPLVDLVLQENQAVIWPYTVGELEFVKGERQLTQTGNSAMAVPLTAKGDYRGLLYLESGERTYTEKDLNYLNALASLVGMALLNAGLIGQLDHRLAKDEEEISSSSDIIGNDHQIKALLGTASQVAQTEARIMLTGEVGTGKEVLARRIHSQSARKQGPYLSLNCSAVPAGQIEMSLFGQDEGEYGGEDAPGILEKADGGTVFIRHVDRLPLSAQVELLRCIEEGLVYRVGSSQPRPSNFRVISSSCVDLGELIKEGEFREDLYQRLTDVTLEMPPLRDLKGDVDTLTRHFLSLAARERGLPAPELDPAASESMRAYPWPGNVGELKVVSDRMVMFTQGGRIRLEDLPPELRFAPEAFKSMDDDYVSETMQEVERMLIRRALARSNGTLDQAAEMLSLSAPVLEELIARYNISME